MVTLLLYIPVSNRSAWEDVLSVKTKVDLLMECYFKVLSMHDSRGGPHSPSQLGGERRDTPLTMLDYEGKEFSYSSVKDWDTFVGAELQRSFKVWEEKFLTEIHQTLVPSVSRYVDGSSETRKVDAHTIASILRVLGSASNLPTKPVYLDTGGHH
jgi:hypothetical protein